jgi:hypothetical protein
VAIRVDCGGAARPGDGAEDLAADSVISLKPRSGPSDTSGHAPWLSRSAPFWQVDDGVAGDASAATGAGAAFAPRMAAT